MKNKRFLPLLTGLLCWLAWPPMPFAPLLLLALVPLFFYVDEIGFGKKSGRMVLAGAAVGFAVWNTLSLYWIYNVASAVGVAVGLAVVLVPILFGTVLMTLPFFLYHKVVKYYGQNIGFMALLGFWIAAEYLHHLWDFAFPWLTLGNGFANFPELIQWYEVTGVFGGSLWVLLANFFAFRLMKSVMPLLKSDKRIKVNIILKKAWPFMVIAMLPMLISVWRFVSYTEKGSPVNVVVVQPNLDPYTDKFDGISETEQLELMIHLSDSLGQKNTEYFIWPETALGSQHHIAEKRIYDDPSVQKAQDFLEKYRNGSLITGANTVRFYDTKKTATAHKFANSPGYYDVYNTALQIEAHGRVQVYHKNKLVPGVEQLPYQEYMGFLGDFMMDMGGTSGTLGHENEQIVFYSQNGIGAAPIICYESVFGAFVGDFVKQGAQLICIVTNDGWWKNTAGYKQHAAYARLRAVETRRSVARSANTGISMLINQKGEVLKETKWDVATAIKGELNLNNELTFYVKHGDYLAKAAVLVALLALIALILAPLLKKKNKAVQKT